MGWDPHSVWQSFSPTPAQAVVLRVGVGALRGLGTAVRSADRRSLTTAGRVGFAAADPSMKTVHTLALACGRAFIIGIVEGGAEMS